MSETEPLLSKPIGAKKDHLSLSERHVVSSSSSATAVEPIAFVDGRSAIGEESNLRSEGEGSTQEMENLSRKSQWIVLALASGGCAAFNGVFAKL
jgi:hypothetical protein